MKVYAIIPAGGSGNRTGSNIPKQYLKFHGKEMIAYTLEVFQQNSFVDEIIIAAKKEYFNLLNEIKNNYHIDKLSGIIEGGKERQDSVFNALSSINADDNDLTAVHDAARPLLSQKVLTNSIQKAKELGNSVVSIKAKDTLVKGDNVIESYLDRKMIHYIQTPQIFRYDSLLKAMEKANNENFVGTDESMLMERFGEKINLVEGSSFNFKVTTESDVELFRRIIV